MSCHASAHLDLAIPNWTPPVVDPMAGAKGKGTLMHKMLEPVWQLSAADMEHMTRVITYVAWLRGQRRFTVLVEEKVHVTWLPSAPWTTADLVFYTADEIHVIDFKWGRIPVDVVNNKQILFYGRSYAHLAPKATGVTGHIVQPYADNFESWFMDAAELARFEADALLADKAIAAGDITFGPSDACMFCPAYPHSRSDKGKPLCPVTMAMLYPPLMDEDEILNG
jgi:Protein of unknown function (DUF2800)